MNKFLVGCCLGAIVVGAIGAMPKKPSLAGAQMVAAMRLINTEEYSYQHEKGRFADRAELLSYLKEKNLLSKAPIDLEKGKPYEFMLVASADGSHYQVSIKPAYDEKVQSTSCQPAVFSDDAALIFRGAFLGCTIADN